MAEKIPLYPKKKMLDLVLSVTHIFVKLQD